MAWTRGRILSVMDNCCESFTFPMLDNGYIYLAACRLSAFRSAEDWHLAIEVFGFSPRAGIPYTFVYHFGSNVDRKRKEENFVTREAYDKFLRNNPNNDSDIAFPIADGDWINKETGETIVPDTSISIRGAQAPAPSRDDFRRLDIELEDPSDIFVHELCRFFAATHRDEVLASEDELCRLVPEGVECVLRLDEWHHPDVVNPERKPSGNETFKQIAAVLETGDVSLYRPAEEPNTHWSNWPEGGLL